MSNYSELLKDPKWQKKRLEILQLDNWTCRNCESKTKTLHVHHLYYDKGRDPWDYPNEVLITLCEGCHEEAHALDWQRAFLDLNFTPQRLIQIAATFKFLIEKHKVLTADVLQKYGTRVLPEYCILPEVDESDDQEELFKMMDFQRVFKECYHG